MANCDRGEYLWTDLKCVERELFLTSDPCSLSKGGSKVELANFEVNFDGLWLYNGSSQKVEL